ncbi:hypothetical protein DFP72DRAFT_1171472 [Ephemerocybe angulata]|uniref:C2H2-type domain-containing protein n=1 Tax=Ephemerocybe angulata TaxID=980116 RepID=A0A8H6M564_9AGAR|nr:hypothetical protein DFP72DRAFT_1171472 [Tulosesus angulatus]
MRVSAFTLISIVASLATYVAAHSPESTYDARELVDEFATRDLEAFDYALERREILADLTTRDLIDELSDRLARRGGGNSKEKGFKCPYCGKVYQNEADAKHCATNPQMLGGCKVNGAVVQGTGRSRSPSPHRRR